MNQSLEEQAINKKYRIFRADFGKWEARFYALLFFLIGLFWPYLSHVVAGTAETIGQYDYNFDLGFIILVGFPIYFALTEIVGFFVVAYLKNHGFDWKRRLNRLNRITKRRQESDEHEKRSS